MLFSCKLLRSNNIGSRAIWCKLALTNFSKTTNCTHLTGLYYFVVFENLLLLINTKLDSKSCYDLYKVRGFWNIFFEMAITIISRTKILRLWDCIIVKISDFVLFFLHPQLSLYLLLFLSLSVCFVCVSVHVDSSPVLPLELPTKW